MEEQRDGIPEHKRIIVISAPSGAGKTSITHRLLDRHPDWRFSISATTRTMRPHEEEGVDYYFLSEGEFGDCVEEGGMVEWEAIFGNRYGTLRREVERLLHDDEVNAVLFDVDVKGALSIREAFPDDAILVFVAPPSIEELERRLRGRQTESEESIRRRVDRAVMELEMQDRFDIIVVNDELDRAVDQVDRLLAAQLPQ
jgi:guanylate kinase